MEKLVRHRIPALMEERGEVVQHRIAAPNEMLVLLRAKLIEEVEELCEAIDTGSSSHVVEELADVHEVVLALRERLGAFEVDEKIREKFFDRGSFMRGVVMTIAPAVPKVLLCPKCEAQHIDRGVWATTRIHRTHLCAVCGHLWKPFEYATVGVQTDYARVAQEPPSNVENEGPRSDAKWGTSTQSSGEAKPLVGGSSPPSGNLGGDESA